MHANLRAPQFLKIERYAQSLSLRLRLMWEVLDLMAGTLRGSARIEVQANSVLLVRTLDQERGKILYSEPLGSRHSLPLCQWYRVLFLSPK